jgi:hypothetical protein
VDGLRLVTGVAIGGVGTVRGADTGRPRLGRGRVFVFSSFAIGAIVASLVGRLVLDIDWRWLFFAGVVSLPAALLVRHLVPPDPARTGNRAGDRPRVGIGAIFEGGLAKTTLLASLVSIVNLAGYWGAAFWIPTFLTAERGLSVTTMVGFSFVMYVGMFFGFQFFGLPPTASAGDGR